MEIRVDLTRWNGEALTAALKTALPDASDGFASDRQGLRLIFTRDLTTGELSTARAIVAAHDPDALTPEQEERQALADIEADELPRVRAGLAALTSHVDDLTNGWAGKTAAQKADALRDAVVLLLRAVRWLLARELRRL